MTGDRRRVSLWARVSLLGVAVALVTGVLAGALAISLIRSADEHSAERALAKLATAAQTAADSGRRAAFGQGRARKVLLQVLRIRSGDVTARGRVMTTFPIVRRAVTPDDRSALVNGQSISTSRTVGGHRIYLEGRPVSTGGGIVLVQARSDAIAGGDQAIRRSLLAILVGMAVAALLGVLFARRLARPLRSTAAAAHALAAGRRNVTVPPEGPAEVAEVAEAVNTLASALSQSEARQRAFLMSVSHDLRTPLTAITGYAESLAGEVVPPERVGEVGGVMLAEARRLERLVGDLLDLARLDAQDFRIDLAPVDLTELARGAARVWDARCRAVGVVFRLEAAPARTVSDATRLRQVLDGLMENALRVTPAGAPIVLAVTTEAGGRACAEVRDGGPGLSDDDLAVAFQRAELYHRYRGVREVGTGLGLAIVERLVTRLGGTVEAGHAPEGGARFTVRLPAAPIAAAPISAGPTSAGPTSS